MQAAPPLLLPGTLCDAALWEALPLPAGTRIVGEVRGRTLEEAAALALAGAPERVHLVGFSLGAIVAFEVLRRSPGRVARLTLIAANPHAPTENQLLVWAEQERRVRAGNFADVAESLAVGARPEHRRTLHDMAQRVGAAAFLEQLSLLRSRPDSRATLQRYSGPLTLLVGQNDTTTPPTLAHETKRLAPQADLRIVAGAGHYLPLDAPQSVAEALRAVAYA